MRGTKWKSDRERFFAKVNRSAGIDACWPWLASKTNSGYGQFKVGGKHGRMVKAHRVSWEFEHGPIPSSTDSLHGTCVCHRCDNPDCVNPRHLFLGTQRINIRDRTVKHRTRRVLASGDVVRIRDMLRAGVKQEEIAAHFGVSRPTISLIKSRTTWGWVA